MFTRQQKQELAYLGLQLRNVTESNTFTDRTLRLIVAQINTVVATESRLRKLEENGKRFRAPSR